MPNTSQNETVPRQRMTFDEFFDTAKKLEDAGVDVKAMLMAALRGLESDGGGSERAQLDGRMAAAGMVPLTSLLEDELPMHKWQAHASVVDMRSFEDYLVRKYQEFLLPQILGELDKKKADQMLEWYLGHSSSYHDILVNFRQAKKMEEEDHAPRGRTGSDFS